MSEVSLVINGLCCRITNEYFSIRFNQLAKATSLVFKGKELLGNLNGESRDPDRNNSFYCDYHVDGKTVNMSVSQLRVISNSKEFVHIAYCDMKSDLTIEYHTLVEAKSTKIFQYLKVANHSKREITINELRTVYRLDNRIFNIAYNSERQGLVPTSAEMVLGKKLQDETYQQKKATLYGNSDIYQKYDYSGYFQENHFWGLSGKKFGFWFIPVNTSYYPGGPLKQDLLVHYDSIILNYLTGSHFGTDNFDIPIGWSKIYGPWCIYLNDKSMTDDLVNDARDNALYEEKQWPYDWLNDENYPLKLTRVHGRVMINKQKVRQHLQIVLAKPDENHDFYRQKSDYIFSTLTDSKGNFEMQNVRPGKYTAYIYSVDGPLITQQYYDNIIVHKQAEEDLGLISLHKEFDQLVWQIGEGNHTTQGFKFSDQQRNYIWHKLIPRNLDYVVGESEDNDWYYAQDYRGRWSIHFKKPKIDSNNYLLTVALAGTTASKMVFGTDVDFEVFLNGSIISEHHFVNDSSVYRSALRNGRYVSMEINIPKEQLQMDNIISFKTNGYVMYDVINLTAVSAREKLSEGKR